ncbi:glycoside hydrolase superfamily [Talaromyces proteolyticus]|uniref:chitinase n=1 Tax=Talaromyces proteolyticus TaxID=1131652 RepID=A0AAD4KDZ8_9EURO|nr:glycoside hydrolase superfamily [Talaromyces proteolyticus]KAH8688769.1 glycoside hydrolase superfamily [Talaromyces proteolyticus]
MKLTSAITILGLSLLGNTATVPLGQKRSGVAGTTAISSAAVSSSPVPRSPVPSSPVPSSAVPSRTVSRAVVPTATASGFRSVAYYADWDIYNTSYFVTNITASTLTHLVYCFADLDANTGSVSVSDAWADLQYPYPGDNQSDTSSVAGNVKQLYLLKQQNRNLKTIFSIGGYSWASKFENFTLTAQGRQTFAQSALLLIQNLGFDGIDIDWEYPSDPEHAQAMVLLLEELRTTLDTYSAQYAHGTHLLLSVAAPAGPANYEALNITGMDQYLDMWNIMAYDYAGSWSNYTGDHANVYPSQSNNNSTPGHTDGAISYYLSQGVAAKKINFGMPLYGRSFTNTSGLGLPFGGVGSNGQGINYNVLGGPNANITEMADVIASYSYDSTNGGTLTSFDTPNIALLKAQYMLEKGIGGAMYWELSGDKTGPESIIATVANSVGNLDQTLNLLSYPQSNYTNIKNKMN